MNKHAHRPVSSGTPFLDKQFHIFCLVFVALVVGLAGWQITLFGLSAPSLGRCPGKWCNSVRE